MTRILLIEPDKLLAETYARALTAQGREVEIQTDAQSAINAVDERRPDTILLEIQMAIHNGVEFLYELRSYPEWQEIPVVIVTILPPSRFDGSRKILKEQLNVTHIFYKPELTLKNLTSVVNEALPAGT